MSLILVIIVLLFLVMVVLGVLKKEYKNSFFWFQLGLALSVLVLLKAFSLLGVGGGHG